MAIALEFIDLVVPIDVIRKKYTGGWEQCLRDHSEAIGRRVWYDDHLFRDGAMSPVDMQVLLDRWTAAGLMVTELRNEAQVWKDVCVVEAIFGGLTLPCDWLVVDSSQRIAYLKGAEPGAVVGRNVEMSNDDG